MSTPVIPAELVRSIRDGNCVAFVGAGFSAPAVPGWSDLLERMAKRLPNGGGEDLIQWLARGKSPEPRLPSQDLEAIAGLLSARVGSPARLDELVQKVVRAPAEESDVQKVDQRVALLAQIPFHSILTTNYDRFLSSQHLPSASTFGKLLTEPPRRWTHALDWEQGMEATVDPERVLKLHGDVDKADNHIVLASRSYPGRTHEIPA